MDLGELGASHLLVFYEGVLVDGLNDVSKQDFGGQSVTMMDNRFPIRAVPAVN